MWSFPRAEHRIPVHMRFQWFLWQKKWGAAECIDKHPEKLTVHEKKIKASRLKRRIPVLSAYPSS
jgi:hypothetical protein